MRKITLTYALVMVCCLLLTPILYAQEDTLKKRIDTLQQDSVLAHSDTSANSNIKANLKQFDTTHPAVYKIRPVPTIIIGAAATAANMIAINNILHNKPDMTLEEVNAANPNSISGFDRWALEQDPTKRDHYYAMSDHVLTGIFIASAGSLLIDKHTRKDWLRLMLMFYETQFITFAVYDFSPFGPSFQNKMRPYVYYDYFPVEDRMKGNQKNSFYSGHVANATSATFFAVKVYCDYHPEIGKKKYLLYGLASLPALFNGWLRIKALAHFPSDALAGYLIGGAFGILIPELHKIRPKNKLQVSTFFNGQSGGLQLRWMIAAK